MNLHLFRKPGQADHGYCQDNLSAYLDGQVSAREKGRVERHLSECGECRRTLSELRATVALLRRSPALPVPRSFALPLSLGVRRTEPRLAWLNPGSLRLAASVATAVLILVVSGDLLLRNGFLESRQSQAPTPEAYGRGGESPVVGTTMESAAEPTAQVAAPMLMAPAPVSDATAADTQAVTDNAETTATGAAQATPESQVLGLQAMPSETFARPAGAPPLPTTTGFDRRCIEADHRRRRIQGSATEKSGRLPARARRGDGDGNPWPAPHAGRVARAGWRCSGLRN